MPSYHADHDRRSEPTPRQTHEHKGIAYFANFHEARDHGEAHGRGFPSWRVINYERGYAVQAYPSGPYFSLSGGLPDYAETSNYNPANWRPIQ